MWREVRLSLPRLFHCFVWLYYYYSKSLNSTRNPISHIKFQAFDDYVISLVGVIDNSDFEIGFKRVFLMTLI